MTTQASAVASSRSSRRPVSQREVPEVVRAELCVSKAVGGLAIRKRHRARVAATARSRCRAPEKRSGADRIEVAEVEACRLTVQTLAAFRDRPGAARLGLSHIARRPERRARLLRARCRAFAADAAVPPVTTIVPGQWANALPSAVQRSRVAQSTFPDVFATDRLEEVSELSQSWTFAPSMEPSEP